ncbi:MAG TPA: ABC transporter ATP-binding protein [Streptosporangiaceae bacterium]|nr:ABC transporter ATP-binding protein [Streptosporangiaceae bacterium]
MSGPAGGPAGAPLLQVRNLVKHFRLPGGWLSGGAQVVHAVDDVSLDVRAGEVLGIVGESGSGKTTLGRLLLRLVEPTSGTVTFDGLPLSALGARDLRRIRPRLQVVFQNPFASLSPRLTVRQVLAEPLLAHRVVDRKLVTGQVVDLLERVGLGPQHLTRYPHELSGGQAQRVAIARALALSPKLVVLDEPTSALDVSVQAQILGVLEDLRKREGLTYVFISHDLSVVHHVSDRIGVMYLGKLVELGPAGQVFSEPLHPYTKALLGALPRPDFAHPQGLTVLEGTVPSPTRPPPGCRFHTRCPVAQEICRVREPALRDHGPARLAACHLISPQVPGSGPGPVPQPRPDSARPREKA